jgi:hypothetical protein
MAERRPDPAVRRLLDQFVAMDLPALDAASEAIEAVAADLRSGLDT